MTSAYRPQPMPMAAGSTYELVSGDMHCHVAPPDDVSDVSRGLPATADLARKEGIDFVVLTPHVWSRFYMDSTLREVVRKGQRDLRAAIDVESKRTGVLFIPGFEYTDHQYGHVGVAFADLDTVLGEVSVSDPPEKFFERWVANGGVLSIHHPLVTPIPGSSFAMARADLSWRPFTTKGPFPAEIDAVTRLAHGLEVFNLTATHLRDRYLLNDGEATIRNTLALMDKQGRRLAAYGGSDSHEDHLRASTFALVKSRSIESIREALMHGRTCVRDAAACSLRANGAYPGDSIHGSSIEVLAQGESIEIFVNGVSVAKPKSGVAAKIAVKEQCSTIRARVGIGWSSPVYVNCAW
jgi:hypothetical protein